MRLLAALLDFQGVFLPLSWRWGAGSHSEDAFGTSLHCRCEIGRRAQVLEYVVARNGKLPI